jgi:hypothetical protein
MTICTHAQLIREVGAIHANDKPPIYRCQMCNEFVRVTLAPDEIGVSYGAPPVPPPAALDVTVAGGEWPEDLWKNLQRILEECNRADLTNAELAKHLRDGVWQYVAALPTRSEAQIRALAEVLAQLHEHVRCLPEYYEWMKGPGSCYPGPKQSLILRHQVLDKIGELRKLAGDQ